MTHYTDETLGAYVDGELDRAAERSLEADLARDTDLRERVAELRAVNRVLRQIGTQIDHEASGAYAPFADVLLHGARPRRPVRRMAMWTVPALAAGVALMVGIGIGQAVNLWRGPAGPVLATADEAAHRLLQAALERELSGQTVSWSDAATQRSVTVQPLRTYRAEGTFCREYRETNSVAQREAAPVYGLACRRQDGTWDVAFTLAPGAQPLLVRQ